MDYILGIIKETAPYQITEGGPVIGECIAVLTRLILIPCPVSDTNWSAYSCSAKTTYAKSLPQITSSLRASVESTLSNLKKSIAIQVLCYPLPAMTQEKVATLSTGL